jgi:sodium/proline symporter
MRLAWIEVQRALSETFRYLVLAFGPADTTMPSVNTDFSIAIFAVTILATLAVSYLGRRHERRTADALATQGLSRWLIGLSAGATANSGFVVTAAVGLGYSYGAQWLLLPIAWLVGDIVFWLLFPQRINRIGATVNASTLTDVVVHDVPGVTKRVLRTLIGLVTLACLGGYVSAQWLSGEKFLSGAFGMSHAVSLFAFAAVIIVYSALGGFRGSVYADTLQAAIRIIGTLIAVIAIWYVASHHADSFHRNLDGAGAGFLSLIPSNGTTAALISCVGFAAAALGFGLGQPQMVTRYLAGASPKETQSAWWVYMLFVQATWIAMTGFGIALRGVMPALDDPETGLSAFHRATTGPVITGIIAADIFATIAATSNSILVAMAQSVTFDLLRSRIDASKKHHDLWIPVVILGAFTMVLSLFLHSTVKDLALSSVGMMGAGLAPAMIIQLLGWRHSSASITAAVVTGFATAAFWHVSGLNATINEAAPGMAAGLLVNFTFVTLFQRQNTTER